MDSTNTPGGEKRPKRPRIGSKTSVAANNDGTERAHLERVTYPRRDNDPAVDGETRRTYQPRLYQPRPGGYQPRPGGYQPRRNYNNDYSSAHKPEASSTEDLTSAEGNAQSTTYQPRQQGMGGYQKRPYQPRQQGMGGYQRQNNYQGGYQGGYPQHQGYYQGGYREQRPQGQGGYPRQGGYQRPQGGYQQRQGGYQQRPQGQGYPRQGGYQQRPQGQGGYPKRGHRQQAQGGVFPGRGKSFTPRPKRIEYEMPIPDPNEKIRLNKFMSNAGICSRREADEFIQQGLVKVNGKVITELGTKISHADVVEYDEKVVALESKCYILLNKPKDCVTTSEDPQDRTTVMDLVKGACTERIYPVGRLDRNTTGVLLLTNDGDLASKLTHPKYIKKKIYHVWCDRDIAEEDMQRIADGIELEDGPIHADAISYATETDRNQAGIEIHSGRNRIVRRIFESLGYHVTKLDRVYFAGLTKKNLPRGRWRYLTQEEVNLLKMGAFE